MLDANDVGELEKIFITRKECDEKNEAIERKLANNTLELALIKQTVDTISWVSKTTLGAVIVALIGALFKFVFMD